MVYSDDGDIRGKSVHTIEKTPETLVVARKEIVLEVFINKTKYMVMTRDQNAGRSNNIKTDNSAFERVGEFRKLGATLRNQNSIQ